MKMMNRSVAGEGKVHFRPIVGSCGTARRPAPNSRRGRIKCLRSTTANSFSQQKTWLAAGRSPSEMDHREHKVSRPTLCCLLKTWTRGCNQS